MSFQVTKTHHIQDNAYKSGCHAIVTEGHKVIDGRRYAVVLVQVIDLDWEIRSFQCQNTESAKHKVMTMFHKLSSRDFRFNQGA